MNANQALKILLFGASVCVGTIAYAATYTWKADENGNWDGNITDPAHWECDTAGSPEYPQSSSDNVKIPQNITAKITIDKSVDTIFGKWELSDKCHVAFTSLMLDNNEMANLKMQSLNVKYGATLILDRGRITHETNDNVSFKRGAKVIVQNGSSLTVKNSYMQELPNYGYSSIYVEVSGKSMATFTTITIGGGAKFVIDDSTVIVRNRLALQTDQQGTYTSDATTMLFKGKGARLLFYEKDSYNAKSLQACMSAKIDGDVLNFDFLVPEGGYSSTPVSMGDGKPSNNLFAAPQGNDTSKKGKFKFNILNESPSVLAQRKIEQNLVEWKRNISAESDGGFCFGNIVEGMPPQGAKEQIFSSGKTSQANNVGTFVYSVSLDCRPTGFKVIIR